MNFLLAAAGVIAISAAGPIMAATAAPALAIAFWRNFLGGVAMGVPAVIARRDELRRLAAADLAWTAVAAGALALHFACFITALQLTSVAAATALVCLQSAWIAVFNHLRGLRTAPAVSAGLALSLAGVVLISGFDLQLSPAAAAGDVLALLGGALAALYTLAGARVRRTLSTQSYTSLCYGLCSVLLLVLCLVFGQPLAGFPAEAWSGILAVTLVAQLMGHTAFNHLLAAISPLVVSMIILLEIPGAALLAALFLGESLPWGTYAGLALILAGLAVVVLWQNRGRNGGPGPAVLGAD